MEPQPEKKVRKRIALTVPVKVTGNESNIPIVRRMFDMPKIDKLPKEKKPQTQKKIKIPQPQPEKKVVILMRKKILTYDEAVDLMKKGKCVTCEGWSEGEFIFMKAKNGKKCEESSPEEIFYFPLTKKFLLEKGLNKLRISSHINKWTGKDLIVGYVVSEEDKERYWEYFNTGE